MGIATRLPAIGPEEPISARTFRFVIGERILIKAPKVPSGGGAGMK
jgi:hypothetical protein